MIGRDGKYAPAPFCKFGQGLFVFSGQCLTSWTETLTHSMSGCNVTGIHFPWGGSHCFPSAQWWSVAILGAAALLPVVAMRRFASRRGDEVLSHTAAASVWSMASSGGVWLFGGIEAPYSEKVYATHTYLPPPVVLRAQLRKRSIPHVSSHVVTSKNLGGDEGLGQQKFGCRRI